MGWFQLLYVLHFPIISSNSVHVFDPLIIQQIDSCPDNEYNFKTQPHTSLTHAN